MRGGSAALHRVVGLEVAEIGLQDVVRAQARRVAADRHDRIGGFEGLDHLGLHHPGRGVGPVAVGEILDDVRGSGERDAGRVDVALGGGFRHDQLPADLGGLLRQAQLRLQRIERQRLVDVGHQPAACETGGGRENEDVAPRGFQGCPHCGFTPLLRSLRKKRAGSRSISWEMRAMEPASSRSCAMRSVAS